MSVSAGRSWMCLAGAVVATAIGCAGPGVAGPPSGQAKVTLSIRIPATARMELPAGAEFVLYLPPDEAAADAAAPASVAARGSTEVPFEISGNAVISVLVEPGTIVGYDADGAIGAAVHVERPDWSLPYRLQLETPRGTLRAPKDGPGHPGVPNPVLGASYSVDTAGAPVTGVVRVVPHPGRASGAGPDQRSGLYRGTVEFTVTAEPD